MSELKRANAGPSRLVPGDDEEEEEEDEEAQQRLFCVKLLSRRNVVFASEKVSTQITGLPVKAPSEKLVSGASNDGYVASIRACSMVPRSKCNSFPFSAINTLFLFTCSSYESVRSFLSLLAYLNTSRANHDLSHRAYFKARKASRLHSHYQLC
ncbi:hypothetical protein L484_011029 [Morus notabilis]|uniref:Uncharacterized protein n=1 Tax=Morus notabilis TaxID=981085 RepID=W9SFB7_9ROSA|nr:hypothetical protein L484_011029 [Morus notabilis]